MFLVLSLNALTLSLCPALALLWNGASCDAGIQIYRRSGVYYAHNNETGQQESLRTSDKGEARRLLSAKNESACMGNLNLQIARAYMVAVDLEMPKRTWREVIRFMIEDKPPGPTRRRLEILEKDKALKPLWTRRVVETRADHSLLVLREGTVSTNVYLPRLHNYALDMNWLAWPILPKKRWPRIVYAEKRGITLEEHQKIIAREGNEERRDYYELLWYIGGSQTDALHTAGAVVRFVGAAESASDEKPCMQRQRKRGVIVESGHSRLNGSTN